MYQLEGRFPRVVPNGRCFRQKLSRTRRLLVKNLLGEGSNRGLVIQITSLILIRKFQIDYVKVTFLGKVEYYN